ncbi:TonB-dependent receptor [Parvularcula sp. ZS-1/3]|uniref:TonB-dependent receptor n=1 Tax=Parvularcula mediterranea TaxID=2732508 RepID=A0A7Y3RLL6_9PROT|nr:TonB-dependent receptor [Parvularcula mediterranea]NNU15840.1 TonB-dependent receptor [Parvularcula mediterranea]
MKPSLRLAAVSAVALQAASAQTVDRITVRAAPPESLDDRPASLSLLDGPIQELISPRAPAELLNRAPGVFVQSGSGREHLTAIRSPVLTGGAGAGSFLFLQDGIPLRAAGFANVNGLFHAGFPFAESVEVLRGPGDVAYGANALHGAINVRSAAPGEGDTAFTLSAGSFDRGRAIGSLNREGLSAGLSVLQDGGYRADSGALELKGQLAAKIGEGTLRLSVHHLEQETAGFVLGDDAFKDDALRRSNPNPDAFRDVRHALVSFEQPFSAGGWEGTVTPFARATDMEFRMHFLPGTPLEENDHASIGVQSIAFRSLSDAMQVAVGFDADITEGALTEIQTAPTRFSFVQGVHYDFEVVAQEAAPFAKLLWEASDRLALEGGVRLTHTRYDYDNNTAANVVGRFRRPADREDDFTTVTGKLAGTFAISPGQSVYASLARGARAPQIAELYRIQVNQDPEGIEPETLDSAELGWRAGGGWGQLALTAFAMRKENVFFRDADGFNVTDGETTHVGVEGEATFSLHETLSLRLSGTYAEHRYGFDRNVGNASEVITDGDTVDTAPETLGTAQLTWTPSSDWLVELAATHVGDYPMNAANTVTYEGHDLLDLRVQKQLGDKLSLTGIVRNALDTRYARRADFAFGNERFFPGEERAYELVLSAKF